MHGGWSMDGSQVRGSRLLQGWGVLKGVCLKSHVEQQCMQSDFPRVSVLKRGDE